MARRKQTKTDKLRKLVQQQVRRMEKRGYIIDDETKAKIKSGKYQTLNSLRKNKYEKLYNQSMSVDVETAEILTGTEFRKQERKEAHRRSVKTRLFNKAQERNRQYIEERKKELERESVSRVEQEQDEPDVRETESYPDEEWTEEDERSYRQWQERRREKDIQDRIQAEEAYDLPIISWEEARREKDIQDRIQAEELDAGEVIYNNVNDLIKAYPTPGSKFLDKALAKEIAKYGRDAVLAGMAQMPATVITEAQNILYYEEKSDAIHSAFIRFFEAIIGTTIDDYAEELGEVMDEMTDYEEV